MNIIFGEADTITANFLFKPKNIDKAVAAISPSGFTKDKHRISPAFKWSIFKVPKDAEVEIWWFI